MAVMRNLYKHKTRIGWFYIAEHEGWFHALYEDEPLGSYSTPELAADDLAGGHTFSNSKGVDTATLGIPEALGEWSRCA
jgi:hypothetical protein